MKPPVKMVPSSLIPKANYLIWTLRLVVICQRVGLVHWQENMTAIQTKLWPISLSF